MPSIKNDADAEQFVESADLSEYDLSGFAPMAVTTNPLAFHQFSEEEIKQSHREWLEKAAASSRRMSLDPEYREERSKMGF